MSRRIMVLVLSVFLLAGISFSAFAQQDIKDVQDSVVALAGDISKALPFNSALGLNWSDAYIGKITDGHFGVGVSVGATTMGVSSIKNLVKSFGQEFPLDFGFMPFPGYTVEGRIGGFVLPFDIGLKFGIIPSMPLSTITLDYLQVGGDLRYAVLDGMANLALPNVSLGFGVSYLSGAVGGIKVATGQQIVNIPFGNERIGLSDADVGLNWNTTALDLKAQISKTFAIVTPYLGLGGSYAFSNAGYSVNATITRNGNKITEADINEINGYLKLLGIDPVDIDPETGISSSIPKSDFAVRVFGGLSLNLAAFRFDLTGLYNILDSNFGGSIGLRFQL